jgi:hypothetical protein
MPPQGESIGLAMEDTILFSRLVLKYNESKTTSEIFEEYERLRKPRIDAAFDEANFRWESAKDKGFVAGILMEYFTTLYLWWTKKAAKDRWAFDIREVELS